MHFHCRKIDSHARKTMKKKIILPIFVQWQIWHDGNLCILHYTFEIKDSSNSIFCNTFPPIRFSVRFYAADYSYRSIPYHFSIPSFKFFLNFWEQPIFFLMFKNQGRQYSSQPAAPCRSQGPQPAQPPKTKQTK